MDEIKKMAIDRNERLSDRLRERSFEYQGSLEKTLLSLSGGSIALSVTLVTRLTAPLQYPNLLYNAWYLFILSIVLTLFSFVTRITALTHAGIYFGSQQSDEKANRKAKGWIKISKALVWGGILTFIVGIWSLTRFCLLNLPQK